MLKKLAIVWGIVFVLIGVLGFIPGVTTEDEMGMSMLLGIFMVSGWHNVVHLATGLAALASANSEKTARLYFITFGFVYLAVTLIGFVLGDGHHVLGFIPVNTADNFLHLAITVAALGIGFGVKPRETASTTATS